MKYVLGLSMPSSLIVKACLVGLSHGYKCYTSFIFGCLKFMKITARQKGIVWLLLAVLLLASKGIFVKFVYQYDVTPVEILLVRILYSLPFFLFILWQIWPEERSSLSWSVLWPTALFGVSGYYVASFFDFWGLLHLPVSLERLVLFSYPGIVVLLAAVFLKQPLNKRLVFWLVLTYVGLCTVFIEDILQQSMQSKEQIKGAILVFIAAISFAIYMVGNETMQRHISSRMFTCIAMLAATAAIIIHYMSLHSWAVLLEIPWQAYAWIFIIAITSTVLPSFLVAAGVRQVGASVAGIVGSTGPVITVILAFLVLGETLSLLQIIGFILVMFAVYRLQHSR